MEFARTFMTDCPPAAESHQTVRAKRLARQMRRNEWRQSCFELVSAGHSYAEVAKRLMVSERTVRRDVVRVIAERRLDAPDR
jgi:DNA-binding NarL/FixJ family response regulator